MSHSGFPVLLAKAIAESVDEVRTEMRQRSQTTTNQKEGNKMKKSELRAALAAAQSQLAKGQIAGTAVDLTGAARTPDGNSRPANNPFRATHFDHAVTVMKSAADEAERGGDVAKAASLRREVAEMKMVAAERRREARPSASQYGPGSHQLFDRTGRLGPDAALSGI
jgi:hypothetical protein